MTNKNNQWAKEILKSNFLDLFEHGLEEMPMKTIEIHTFDIKILSIHQDRKPGEVAVIIGLISDKPGESETDFTCPSFMIRVEHRYYYREFFYEAMEVIRALRIINDYQHPIPEESFSITF